MNYLVVCRHPDGGDVIEGRHPPVREEFATLDEAVPAAAKWHRRGPNGPVRSADLYRRDGDQWVKVDVWDEMDRTGHSPYFRLDFYERERLVGARPPIS